MDQKLRSLKSRSGTHEADGVVKEVRDGRVYFQLDWSEPSQGLIHVVSIAGAGLGSGKSADDFQIGGTFRIRLQFSQRPYRAHLGELPATITPLLGEQGPFKRLDWRESTLYFEGQMAYSMKAELCAKSDVPAYSRAIANLYRFSNRFWAQVVDTEWIEKAKKYQELVGKLVKGIVVGIIGAGALVELEPDVVGLVHVSEMAWGFVRDPGDIVQVGEERIVRILSVDLENRRIALSLKIEDPWKDKYKEGQYVRGRVARFQPYGAFVELEPGVDGLLHKDEMQGGKVEQDEEILVLILRVDIERKRISLRLVRPKDDPLSKYRVGQRYKGQVIQLKDAGALVRLEPGVEGMISTTEMQGAAIREGAEIAVRVLAVNLEKRELMLGMEHGSLLSRLSRFLG